MPRPEPIPEGDPRKAEGDPRKKGARAASKSPEITARSRDGREPEGRERRRWQRASADWPIQLALADGRFEARVRDVSQAGVCFFLDRPIAAMTVLAIDLELPVPSGKRYVKGRGVVVRCERISERIDHYEIAVFLEDLAQPDREALAGYVLARRAGGRAVAADE